MGFSVWGCERMGCRREDAIASCLSHFRNAASHEVPIPGPALALLRRLWRLHSLWPKNWRAISDVLLIVGLHE